MTIHEARRVLLKLGWKEFNPTPGATAVAAFQRRLNYEDEAQQCLTNDYKTGIHAWLYEDGFTEVTYRTITFEIVGEYRHGMWCKLQVYSIRLDDFLGEIDAIENELRAAWEAFCTFRRPTPIY